LSGRYNSQGILEVEDHGEHNVNDEAGRSNIGAMGNPNAQQGERGNEDGAQQIQAIDNPTDADSVGKEIRGNQISHYTCEGIQAIALQLVSPYRSRVALYILDSTAYECRGSLAQILHWHHGLPVQANALSSQHVEGNAREGKPKWHQEVNVEQGTGVAKRRCACSNEFTEHLSID
jgi:hypothetical protein